MEKLDINSNDWYRFGRESICTRRSFNPTDGSVTIDWYPLRIRPYLISNGNREIYPVEGGRRGLARLILQDSEAVVESLKFSSPCRAMASNRTLKKDSIPGLSKWNLNFYMMLVKSSIIKCIKYPNASIYV